MQEAGQSTPSPEHIVSQSIPNVIHCRLVEEVQGTSLESNRREEFHQSQDNRHILEETQTVQENAKQWNNACLDQSLMAAVEIDPLQRLRCVNK